MTRSNPSHPAAGTDHPDLGALRAAIDAEADATVMAHLSTCPVCAEQIATLRSDADLVGGALALLAPASPDGLGMKRPQTVVALPAAAPRRRLQRLIAVAAAIVVAAVVVGTPTGRDAAVAFLAQFRSERIAVITVDPEDLPNPFEVLANLGTVSGAENLDGPQPVATIEDAERQLGFAIATPADEALPDDAPAARPFVFEGADVRLTFDETRVREWISSNGGTTDTIPVGLDGASLVVHVPAAGVVAYGNEGNLLVGTSRLVTAEVEGDLSLAQVRELLLSLPGLPPETVRQVRAIEDWRSTLPLPIPADQFSSTETTVGGIPAVALEGANEVGAALLWQDNGFVHGAGGLNNASAIRRVAEAMVVAD